MSESSRPFKPVAKSSSRSAPPKSAPPQIPPRVVKKKKPVKRESTGVGREKGPSEPHSEFLVPIILIVVGLVVSSITTIMLRPEGTPFVLWVAIRMTLIVVSSLLTYGALFIAAQVLDTDYGYISTGALKVIAITLTQGWVGDLASEVPIPLLPWLVAVITTYSMFMYFFDLGLGDAIASVVVVRLVHFLALVLLLGAIIGAAGGAAALNLAVPDGPGAAADRDAGEEPDDEEPMDPNEFNFNPGGFQQNQ